MRYRTIPAEVEALFWSGGEDGAVPILDWLADHGFSAYFETARPQEGLVIPNGVEPEMHPEHLHIHTGHGPLYVFPGSWLVLREGQISRYLPEAFAARYVAVTTPTEGAPV